MKTRFLLLALLCGSVSVAQAHTHLQKSSPADGATLSTAPTEVVFQFSEPTRLTAATVQKEGEKLPPAALKAIEKQPAVSVSVPLGVALSAGKYLVTWRALGPDNHVMAGKFRFSIASR